MISKYFDRACGRYVLMALSTLLVLAGAQPVQAAPTMREVAKQLICTCADCGRQALDQCPDSCADGRERRAVVSKLLAEGKSTDQIRVYFADTFGDETLGDPLPRGAGKLAPIVPLAAVLLGAIPFALFARSRRRPTKIKKGGSAASNSHDPRVDAALKDYDY